MLAELMPDESEALGLVALMELQASRAAARTDAAGNLVLLADQDRARWDPDADRARPRRISIARAPIEHAGPYRAAGRHRRLSRARGLLGGDGLAPDRRAL